MDPYYPERYKKIIGYPPVVVWELYFNREQKKRHYPPYIEVAAQNLDIVENIIMALNNTNVLNNMELYSHYQ